MGTRVKKWKSWIGAQHYREVYFEPGTRKDSVDIKKWWKAVQDQRWNPFFDHAATERHSNV